MLVKFEFLSSIPSIMVVALPNFRVSRRIRMRCCSFSISPQTHRSLGSPHVEQTSAMTLIRELSTGIYKSFKDTEVDYSCFSAGSFLLETEYRALLAFFSVLAFRVSRGCRLVVLAAQDKPKNPRKHLSSYGIFLNKLRKGIALVVASLKYLKQHIFN